MAQKLDGSDARASCGLAVHYVADNYLTLVLGLFCGGGAFPGKATRFLS